MTDPTEAILNRYHEKGLQAGVLQERQRCLDVLASVMDTAALEFSDGSSAELYRAIEAIREPDDEQEPVRAEASADASEARAQVMLEQAAKRFKAARSQGDLGDRIIKLLEAQRPAVRT